MGGGSFDMDIEQRYKELERKLVEIEKKAGSSGVSSASVAIHLKNQELERKLAEMERSAGSRSMSSYSVAIQLRNQELERKLAEIERGRSDSSRVMNPASVAAHKRNQELERKLAELEGVRSGSSRVMSSASLAANQKNQELERKVAELEMGETGTTRAMSSASLAINEKNQELERKLADLERGKSGSTRIMSSASAVVNEKNRELERKLAELDRAKSGSTRVMSSASVAVNEKNRELERKLVELEKGKSGSTRVMSSASIAVNEKNRELERKLAELERAKLGSSRVMSSASVAVNEKNRELEQKIAELEMNKSASGRVMSSASMAIMKKNEKLARKFEGLRAKRVTDTLSPARQEKVKKRLIQLKKLIADSQELDLAFLVDVTGSMQAFINSVKENAPGIAARVKKAWPQLKLRVAFAPYRDYEDGEKDDAETCDFTDDFSTRDSVFVEALSEIRAVGGGDAAEDVFSGLERAVTLSWKSRTRVLVHIGDAPCHGKEFHDGLDDRCPEGDQRGRDIHKLLGTLRNDCQIICYLFCHVNNSTKKMLRVFKENCGDENWIQEEMLDNLSKLADIVVDVSTASISRSLQVGEDRPVVCNYVNLPVQSGLPDWEDIPRKRANQIRYKLPDSLEDLFHALRTNGNLEMEDMPDSTVQIAFSPFSKEGSLRWPYHAMVHKPPSDPRHVVVKRFKTTLGKDVNLIHAKEAYFEQMEVQTVAAKMAKAFNAKLSDSLRVDYKSLQFTPVSSLRVGSKFYNMEQYLEGKWIRYSNNLNYVNTQEYAPTLHAFSHWTHHISNGLLMVNDLQGVEIVGTNGSKEFWLCDPAVHCKDALRYERTRTNWSEPGMKRFLETHECNYICQILGIPKYSPT